MSDAEPYNPLDRNNLGRSVADAMLATQPVALGSIKKFKGAGIYALYYHGPHPAYEEIAKRNRGSTCTVPIYVGKAVPPGARKGHDDGQEVDPKTALYGRLREHGKSIKEASSSLDISDFSCRYLTVEDIWIPLGESLLIARFSPLWNKLVDGFGNHTPGKGRFEGQVPRWDVLHPGRSWALKCKPRQELPTAIEAEIKAYLRTANLPPIPASVIKGDE